MFNQLPVPFNTVDQSTFNGNLPNGNDAVPNIQLSQQMMQNQQVALQAIGYFRAIAQSTAQKTALHAFCYNLLSQNRFNNQVYTQWCQHLMVFVELLIIAKGYDSNKGIETACTRLYEAFLSKAWDEYKNNGLGQHVPNTLWPGLDKGLQLFNQIMTDNQKYQQGGAAAFQQQQFNGFNNTPNSFQQPQQSFNNGNLPRINGGAVQQQYNASGFNPGVNTSAYQQTGSTVEGGIYDDPIIEAQKPLTPVEEISSDVYSQYPTSEYAPMNTNGTAPQSNNNFTQANNVMDTDLPIPLTVDEVVIDPTYYQPHGFKLDLEDAYGLIFNPGGIEIRPEHRSTWEVTAGDDSPYGISIDPKNKIMFHVRFPDGTVKEKAVEWTNSMNYMRHELDVEMRRRAHRPNGIVVETRVPISTVGGDAVPVADLPDTVKEEKLKVQKPIILDAMFTGSTDMEIREAVVEEMSSLLGTEFSTEYPMPAVEYVSVKTHNMRLTDEQWDELEKLSTCGDIGQVAYGIKDMYLNGMGEQYYRFVVERLTKSVNTFMRENMSLTVEIDDFVEEGTALLDYMAVKKGQRYLDILKQGAPEIIRKAISVNETDTGRCIIDYTVNFQLGWYLDELTSLNIHSGKPVLVSISSHEIILETVRGMIRRQGAENIHARHLRLITADGAVIEVIRGYLVDKAMLLKLVK